MTDYQLKRIRRANATGIAKMVDQERYWSTEAFQEICKRVDRLNRDDPNEAFIAEYSVLELVERIREVNPDIRAYCHSRFDPAGHWKIKRGAGDL